MKAIEQYFPVVLFIMPYNVVLTFEPVDEILKCDYSNKSCFPVVLFNYIIVILYKIVITFGPVNEIQLRLCPVPACGLRAMLTYL